MMKMSIKPLALIIRTSFTLSGWMDGRCLGPVVLIRPEAWDDAGIMEHELTHTRQFWSSFGTMGLFYLFSKKHRMGYEVEAYRAQIREGLPVKRAAELLAGRYGLGITAEQAERSLTDGI